MDEEGVERFRPTITPQGIAGLWLQKHVPSADFKTAESLGNVIEALLAEGIRKGKLDAIKTSQENPDLGAAIASLEADIIELEHAINKKRVEGIDYDVFKI